MESDKIVPAANLEEDFQKRLRHLVGEAPWVLRITEYKDKQGPVLVVKERRRPEDEGAKPVLKDRGLLYGQALRRCLPILRSVVSRVNDQAGIPLELQRFLNTGRISFRGNLPLDVEAGAKLSLIFKLQEGIKDMDRVELIALRVDRFSREEATYWLTRVTGYGDALSRWSLAGMRIMLGGHPGDKAIADLLQKLRK